MAYTCTVQEKRTFPVSIGSHIFYVELYQLTGIRKFAEQTTIAGMSVFSNQAIRSRVLHMEGRFLRTDPPAELLLTLETALQEQTTFTAVLDGVRYRLCRLSQYRFQEVGHSGTVACQLDCLVSQLEAVEEKAELLFIWDNGCYETGGLEKRTAYDSARLGHILSWLNHTQIACSS